MPGNVAVNDLPPAVPNNKEAIQQLERDRWDGEEIHGRDRFAMIAEKDQPAPGRFRVSGRTFHPTGNTSFRYLEAKHEQLAVDTWRTPGWIFCHHAEDHIANFLRQSVSTDLFLHLGDQTPVKSNPDTMPADRCFRSDDKQRFFPAGPEAAGQDPEELIEDGQFGPPVSTFEYTELLTKCEVLHEQVLP